MEPVVGEKTGSYPRWIIRRFPMSGWNQGSGRDAAILPGNELP